MLYIYIHIHIYVSAAIAQLGERQTEDLKVLGSSPGLVSIEMRLEA